MVTSRATPTISDCCARAPRRRARRTAATLAGGASSGASVTANASGWTGASSRSPATYADRGACAEGRALARAWEEADAEARQEAEAAWWAEEFERRATRCDWCGSDLGRRKQGGESPELCARCFADARDLGHPAVLAQAEEAARPLKGEQSCAGGDKRPSFGGVLLSYPGDVDLERDPSPARDAGL